MSNLLAPQLCSLVGASQSLRKVWFIIEQPCSSYLFKMNCMLALAAVSMLHKDHNMDPSFDLMYVFFSDFDVVLYVLSCAEPLHTSSNF